MKSINVPRAARLVEDEFQLKRLLDMHTMTKEGEVCGSITFTDTQCRTHHFQFNGVSKETRLEIFDKLFGLFEDQLRQTKAELVELGVTAD